jgi:hypothetical protein
VTNAKEHRIRYRLTEHARQAIAERRICPAWLEKVLADPLKVEKDREDPTLQHALGRIPERGDKVLRVIYNVTIKPWPVVTAFFDRKAGSVL